MELAELAEKVAGERPELADWAFRILVEARDRRQWGIAEVAFRNALGEVVRLRDLRNKPPTTWAKKWCKHGVFRGMEPVIARGEFREFVERLPDDWLTTPGERARRQLLQGYFGKSAGRARYAIRIGGIMYVPTLVGPIATYGLAYYLVRSVPDHLLAGARTPMKLVEVAEENELAITSKDIERAGLKPEARTFRNLRYVTCKVRIFFPTEECKLAGRFDVGLLELVTRYRKGIMETFTG